METSPLLGLDGVDAGAENKVVEVLALDEALTELASFDERAGRVVELRFFAGLSIAETAEALDVSSATVERDWTVAKAWLLQRLAEGDGGEGGIRSRRTRSLNDLGAIGTARNRQIH